jgi:hypothetical protein
MKITKGKTLRKISTKEYVVLPNNKDDDCFYLCEIPYILASTAEMEDIKHLNPQLDFTDIELIGIEVHDFTD